MGRVAAMQARMAQPEPATHEFDLFVVYAASDADFVHGYLLPALNLPPARVLLVDELTPGALVVSEIARGVARSRYTVAVLSPAYLADRWAVFGEQLASYVSVEGERAGGAQVIPLHLIATPAETIAALVARQPSARRVLVFVDQFEELFTLAGAAERQRFVAAIRSSRGGCKVNI